MLIALFGIYCAAATFLALGLLRGGSCLRSEDAAALRGVPEGACCPVCLRETRGAKPPLAAGFGTGN